MIDSSQEQCIDKFYNIFLNYCHKYNMENLSDRVRQEMRWIANEKCLVT